MNARRILLDVFDVALRAVDGRASVDRFLREANLPAPIEVFAVGKAASSMARGAQVALGSAVERMLVITKDGHTDPALDVAPGVTQLQSAHPVPDLRSFSNGAELEERVRSLREDIFPLFLISGGSSSLVEALRDGVSLGEVQALNVQGLASGWDIAMLNIARARLSRIKGGGIARLLRERRALALFISDVPGDDPDVIGSGLLGRDVGIADGIERHVVATIETAVRAVQDGARAHGLDFEAVSTRFDGDVGAVTAELLARLRACKCDGIVWGGESTVTLPPRHGRGGRNTHLALSFARQAARRRTVDAAGRGHRRHGRPDRRRGCHRRCGNDRACERSRAATSSARGASSIPAARSRPRKISCTQDPPARMSGIS